MLRARAIDFLLHSQSSFNSLKQEIILDDRAFKIGFVRESIQATTSANQKSVSNNLWIDFCRQVVLLFTFWSNANKRSLRIRLHIKHSV